MKEKLNKAKSYEKAAEFFLKAKNNEKAILFYRKALEKFVKLGKQEEVIKASKILTNTYKSQNDEKSQIIQMKKTLIFLEQKQFTKMEQIILKLQIADLLVFQTFKKANLNESILVK